MIADASICGAEYGVMVGTCSADDLEKTTSYGATDVNDVRYFPSATTPTKATGWFNGNVVLIPYGAYNRVGVISGDYSHSRADYDYAERLKRNGIAFFASSKFVGVCRRVNSSKVEGKRLFRRLALLGEPGHFNLRDLWIYKKRYWGITRAVISICHLVMITLFANRESR